MTTDELSAILARVAAGLPVCVAVGGVLYEIEAVLPIRRATYLPTDGLVARGPVIGERTECDS